MKKEEQGLSPVVATVLLIAIVMVIALILFLWFRGMIEEPGIKFDKNIKLACEDVDFEVDFDSESGMLTIVNNGNVPIYKFKLKIESEGSYTSEDIKQMIIEDSDGNPITWPSIGLTQGGIFLGHIGDYTSDAERILVIPVLLGKAGTTDKTYTCEERFSQEVEA
jgi:hypothetical protein